MKKISMLFGVLLLALSTLFLVGCETKSTDLQYLTIEINPGIEILLNELDEITEITPLNEDGEILLVNLELVGMDIEDAIETIIDEATELGYVNVEQLQNQVRIQAFGKDNATALKLGEKVRVKVQSTLQTRGINGEAVMKEFGEAEQTAAQNKGVDVAKYVMAQQILYHHPEMTETELLEKSLKELIEMKQEQVREMKEVATSLKVAFHEELLTLLDEYKPLIQALEAEIETLIASIASETDADAKAALEATLLQKQDELEALKLEFKEAREALRDEYLPQSASIKSQLQIEHQNRIQEFQAIVNQFRQEHPLPNNPDANKKP